MLNPLYQKLKVLQAQSQVQCDTSVDFRHAVGIRVPEKQKMCMLHVHVLELLM